MNEVPFLSEKAVIHLKVCLSLRQFNPRIKQQQKKSSIYYDFQENLVDF